MSPSPRIFREAELPMHDRGGGVRTRYLVSREVYGTTFLSGVTEFEPGAALAFHSHNCGESVVILEGPAIFDTENSSTPLASHDATWVPPYVIHRFRNKGHATMKILWTYGSPDATRTIAETGETSSVAVEMVRAPS